MNLRQLGIGARGLPVRSDGQIILLLDDVFLPESLMHACGIGIDAGELAIGPAGELRPGGAQLVRIFRFLWSQLHKLLVFLDGSYPVVRDLVGSRQLQVGLRLFRQQGDGALEFAHGRGIFSERQEAGTEEQAGRAVIRLKSEGLIPCRRASEKTCSAESRSPDLSAWTPAAIFVSNEGGRFSCARARAAMQKYSKRNVPRRGALAGNTAKRRGFDQRLERVMVDTNPLL